MEGITILKEIPVYQQIMPEFPTYIIYIALALGLIIGAIFGVVSARKAWSKRWKHALSFVFYITTVFCMTGMLIGMLISGFVYKSQSHEVQNGDLVCMQYEVTVDGEVPVSELFENYHVEKIVSQENLIFLVKERSDVDLDVEKTVNASLDASMPMVKAAMVSIIIIFSLIALGCVFSWLDKKEMKNKER